MFLRFALLMGALSVTPSCHRASAAPELPTRMDPIDAARLDRALSHLRELQIAARPYETEVNEVCARWKISARALLSEGTVKVNFSTGDIQRVEMPTVAPIPTPSEKK